MAEQNNNNFSFRSNFLIRRTYNRPFNDEGTVFETFEQTVDRVIGHQAWLWERSQGRELSPPQHAELGELRQLMLERKVLTSGRTLWLGGTDVAKKREASQFNCAFTYIESVYDVVDALWLLMQGCGVGFKPIVGQLTGFRKPLDIEVIRSTRKGKGGNEHNEELYDGHTWTIRVGDSAEAWCKAVGKLVAHKYPAEKLVIDLSNIRPAGERLRGYGWISSGDAALARAMEAIAHLFNRRADSLLTRIDILDLANWLGTVLSSRRSAEIAIFDYGEEEWQEFAVAKRNWWEHNPQRAQSNNSLLFNKKPLRSELEYIFGLMLEAGGSEPGFINAEEARKRAPWFKGCNPCVEILLGNKSFCNLTETDLSKFKGDSAGLRRAITIASRANYRQTCVNLLDGILQEAWHLNNDFLRLCGVGLTGIATRPDLKPYDLQELQRVAIAGAYGMADELDTPRPKNVTTVKPSGTLSKIMDTTEGVHKPLGRYVFNNVNLSKHDPLVALCRSAGYRVFDNPSDSDAIIVTLPVEYEGVPFETFEKDGLKVEVNLETAISQLERYKLYMGNWCQQNVSATIYYSPDELPDIISWLLENWNVYVGVSFLLRSDPTKTAKDLGYQYLPQEVVTKETYDEYVKGLQPVNLDEGNLLDADVQEDCATGACPVR